MSALIRYQNPVNSLSNLIDEFFNDSLSSFESPAGQLINSSWPSVDIVENEESYTIHADLPGLDKNDIRVNVENDMLTISGEKKTERKEKRKGSYSYFERSYGSFSRSFRLPEHVDKNSIGANYKNGVLELTLKKTEAAKPRQITIDVK